MSEKNTTCDQCGVRFHRFPSRTKLNKHNYCSLACSHQSRFVDGVTQAGYRDVIIKRKHHLGHRLLMAAYIGRELGPDEVVHHKDGNRLNNGIHNLELMTRSDHTQLHNPLSWDIERAKVLRSLGLNWAQVARTVGAPGGGCIKSAFATRSIPDPCPSKRAPRQKRSKI